MKTIEVVPYDPNWPKQYDIEAQKIIEALGGDFIAIHHIGSTSVPGLAAKRDLDILLIINNLNNSLLLQDTGYTYKGEFNIPLRYFFSKNTTKAKVNLHVCEKEHSFISLNLTFRDWLIDNPSDAQDYQNLKYEILKSPDAGRKSIGIFSNYSIKKNNFIKGIIKKSGYSKIIVNFCLHENEWLAAKNFRNKYFFKHKNMEDPYTWTFDHKDHKHFVLYQGAEIIGYSHVQLWPEHRVALRIISIDEKKRNNSYGSQLMQLIEKWLKNQDYKSIHVESTPETLAFYKKNGYIETPFNDPDSYPCGERDIAAGKIL